MQESQLGEMTGASYDSCLSMDTRSASASEDSQSALSLASSSDSTSHSSTPIDASHSSSDNSRASVQASVRASKSASSEQTFATTSWDICQVVRTREPPPIPLKMEVRSNGFEVVRTKNNTGLDESKRALQKSNECVPTSGNEKVEAAIAASALSYDTYAKACSEEREKRKIQRLDKLRVERQRGYQNEKMDVSMHESQLAEIPEASSDLSMDTRSASASEDSQSEISIDSSSSIGSHASTSTPVKTTHSSSDNSRASVQASVRASKSASSEQTFATTSWDICQVVRTREPPPIPLKMEVRSNGFEVVRTKNNTGLDESKRALQKSNECVPTSGNEKVEAAIAASALSYDTYAKACSEEREKRKIQRLDKLRVERQRGYQNEIKVDALRLLEISENVPLENFANPATKNTTPKLGHINYYYSSSHWFGGLPTFPFFSKSTTHDGKELQENDRENNVTDSLRKSNVSPRGTHPDCNGREKLVDTVLSTGGVSEITNFAPLSMSNGSFRIVSKCDINRSFRMRWLSRQVLRKNAESIISGRQILSYVDTNEIESLDTKQASRGVAGNQKAIYKQRNFQANPTKTNLARITNENEFICTGQGAEFSKAYSSIHHITTNSTIATTSFHEVALNNVVITFSTSSSESQSDEYNYDYRDYQGEGRNKHTAGREVDYLSRVEKESSWSI